MEDPLFDHQGARSAIACTARSAEDESSRHCGPAGRWVDQVWRPEGDVDFQVTPRAALRSVMLPAIPRPRAGLGPGREGSVSDDDRHGEEERESGELPTESF